MQRTARIVSLILLSVCVCIFMYFLIGYIILLVIVFLRYIVSLLYWLQKELVLLLFSVISIVIIFYFFGSVDIIFSRQLLTPDDSLSNLRAISRHCNRFLPQPKLHILPEHWLTHHDHLKPHILSFLSLLFHTMTKINKEELKGTSTCSVPLLSRETLINRTPRIRSTEHVKLLLDTQ